MICYPEDVTDDEISVIDDYWLLSEESRSGFLYTLRQIDNNHKSEQVRPVSVLAGKSRFFIPNSTFICQDCQCKIPVKNRREYTNRKNAQGTIICAECSDLRQRRLIEKAQITLREYISEKFKPEQYLDSLSIEESLALLSISAEQTEQNKYLGESLEDVSITDIQSIDYKIVSSLVDKKALIHIPELPSDVERANEVIYGDFSRVTYDNRYRKSVRYRHPDSIVPGVYLNTPILNEHVEASDITSILYHNVQSSILSVDDVKMINLIVKEMQLGKLYKLVDEVSKDKKIPIANSNVLRALLNHLAEYYPPQNIFFTFMVKAREAIEYIYKESIPVYRAKNFFANFVDRYIQRVENKGEQLYKAWTLPPHIQTSPFEALFSQIYLNGHFNWNKLSAKEVVTLWLENV
jgi:hypothetical protein